MDTSAFSEEATKMAEMNIPISPSGEIMVKGKVYAPNGIGMKAPSITVDSAAQLKTGNIDFIDLVNAGTTDNTVFDGSQNLTATMTDSGDIMLAVYSDIRNKKDDAFTDTIAGITSDAEILANYNTIEASVTSKGTIDAAGNVSITAEAANGQQFYAGKFDMSSGFGTNEEAAYQIAQSVAKIDIADGSVSGQEVAISANADNSYIDSDSLVKMIGINVLGAVTVNMDVAVSYIEMDNEATVNIDGTLRSAGNTKIDAKAETQMIAKAAAKTTTLFGSESILDVAVAVANGDTRANVNIGNMA